jgi:hypothetical protein
VDLVDHLGDLTELKGVDLGKRLRNPLKMLVNAGSVVSQLVIFGADVLTLEL